MAKVKTQTTQIKPTEKKEVKEIPFSVKMINTYIGTKGVFYKNQIYTPEATFAQMLVKRGDAEKC